MEADVFIVGTGQAGVPLATRLAAAGKRVIIAERGDLGGTCTNTGCTPTKTLVASARAAHVARTAGRLGVKTSGVELDFPAVIARKDRIVAQWQSGVARRLSGAERLTLLRGHARFVDERTLEVNGERHHAETVVINAGCRPSRPPIDGLDSVPTLDNRTVMELHALPEHLLVLGGGYIGCEFGQMFRRFGSQVTVVDGGAHLLAREDEAVSAALEDVFRSEGIALHLGQRPIRVAREGDGIAMTLEKSVLRGSHLLVATGRVPNTGDLGCDRAGVALDARGFVTTDDHYRTSAQGVYAVGDVAGEPQFTHVAWDDHRILFELLTGRSQRGREHRVIPSVAFTDPQVARVGLTAKEAKAQGLRHEVATFPFGHVARAIEIDETAGVIEVVIDPDSERLLGASIVGAEAGELIHVFGALMQAGASARHLVDGQCAHPTFCEGLQSALMALPRFALS